VNARVDARACNAAQRSMPRWLAGSGSGGGGGGGDWLCAPATQPRVACCTARSSRQRVCARACVCREMPQSARPHPYTCNQSAATSGMPARHTHTHTHTEAGASVAVQCSSDIAPVKQRLTLLSPACTECCFCKRCTRPALACSPTCLGFAKVSATPAQRSCHSACCTCTCACTCTCTHATNASTTPNQR
jgi:hypothetical protein